MRRAILAMTKSMHEAIFDYLFPGDGLEAAGVLLCNQGTGKHYQRLLAAEFLRLPHDLSERGSDFVSWPFDEYMTPDRIGEADRERRTIVAIHSHPKGGDQFSRVDDKNDLELLKSIDGWFDDERMNGVAFMTPDGAIVARTMDEDRGFRDIEAVSVVGDSIRIWNPSRRPAYCISSENVADLWAGNSSTSQVDENRGRWMFGNRQHRDRTAGAKLRGGTRHCRRRRSGGEES